MGSGGAVSIWFTQETDYNSSNSHPARQCTTFPDRGRQFGFCNQSHIVSTVARRQQMAPSSVPFQVPFSGRAELQNPQQVSNCEGVRRVEAFCGRSGALLWDLDWSQNLQYFMPAKKLNQRQARWSLFLAWFDFIMHHHPRKSIRKTDALSRRSNHGTGLEDNDNMVLLTPISLQSKHCKVGSSRGGTGDTEGYPEGNTRWRERGMSGEGCKGTTRFVDTLHQVCGVVLIRWTFVLPGQDLCSRHLQSPSKDCHPLSQLLIGWAQRKMEDIGTGVLELLVATDVGVCWQVHLHLWHVPLDQVIPTSSDRRTPPSCHSICSMGHHQCGLHCRAATFCGARFHHGCCQFHHQACTFFFHCHNDLCCQSHTPFPQPCVETSWSPSESRLRKRSPIHSRIHPGTLPVAWN